MQSLARRLKTAQALAMRARIVLACADGLSNSEVSRRLSVSLPTIGKWRKRFVADRIDGLLDEPRPGAPRKIGDAQVEAVGAAYFLTRTNPARHTRRLIGQLNQLGYQVTLDPIH